MSFQLKWNVVLLTLPISFNDVVLFSPLLFDILLLVMLLLLARFETAKFFQDGDISVPLIPKDLLDGCCCCCCSLLVLLDPCLSTSPTKEDIPLRDLQPFKGWYSSPLMFPVPGGFVSHVVMTFVKLLLLLLILPFKLVDDIGTPLSSDILLLVVLKKMHLNVMYLILMKIAWYENL